ncbi:ABC transporter ced-7 [Dermacentor silvarum]|uniref:ABC transporter ced-7 n=1 Tax=Dermacentor silvarum TaxID=543639 RepID=UPI0018988BC4|nr:ABC transporter ced-7 [Dermacentor silvarum]
MVEKLVSEPKPHEYALVVRQLTKSFGPCRGVNNVSFALKRRQCLGIIGVTGSGKTKLMQLLTATSKCSSGYAYIGSWSLLRTPTEYASNIGYCPEALGLPEHLTGREIIELICVLRGYRLDDTATMAKNLLQVMELSKVANVIAKNYTPGDKRKLSIAIALAGLPSAILLDEPSTGVDVAARAQIRRSLSIIREAADCAILLTSNKFVRPLYEAVDGEGPGQTVYQHCVRILQRNEPSNGDDYKNACVERVVMETLHVN